MTKQEIAKLIAVTKALYPNHFKGYSAEDTEYLIAGWGSVLSDYTYEQAGAGLKKFFASDTKGFPPSPGQIIFNMPPQKTEYELLAEKIIAEKHKLAAQITMKEGKN
mgnify:CR=1 FL=1